MALSTFLRDVKPILRSARYMLHFMDALRYSMINKTLNMLLFKDIVTCQYDYFTPLDYLVAPHGT